MNTFLIEYIDTAETDVCPIPGEVPVSQTEVQADDEPHAYAQFESSIPFIQDIIIRGCRLIA
jgi:hypothetical protein